MTITAWLKRARRTLDGYTGGILISGLAAVLAYQNMSWRRDCQLITKIQRERTESRRGVLEGSNLPRISILVAAWNEADFIASHLESIRSLRYANFEYILCAGGADDTYEIATRYAAPRVIILEQQRGEGKQAALQRCLDRATGEVIFLTDADCLLDDLSFEGTIRPVLAGEVEAATGGYRPLPEQMTASRADPLVLYRWSADAYTAAHASTETTGISGTNAAISRVALGRAGDFHADVPTGTDYHLAKSLKKAGAKIWRVSGPDVATEYPVNLKSYARQQRRWLRNILVLGKRFGAWSEVFAVARTVLLGLVMVIAPILAPLIGRWILAGWAVAVAHSAASKIRYLMFAARLEGNQAHLIRPTLMAWAIPISLLDFAVWCLPILDLLSPSRRRQW